MAKIYVASSWSNSSQPVIVAYLRSLGHDVYDFRKPSGVLEDNVWNEKSVKDIAFPHRMTEKDFTTVCKMPVVKKNSRNTSTQSSKQTSAYCYCLAVPLHIPRLATWQGKGRKSSYSTLNNT